MSNLKFELLIGMNGSGKSTYLQNKYDELTVTKKGTINPNRAYISNSEINFSAELKKDYSKTIKDLIELLYEKNFVLKLDEKNINNIASYKKIIEDDKIILDNLKHDEDFSFWNDKQNSLELNLDLQIIKFDNVTRENMASGLANYSTIKLITELVDKISLNKISSLDLHTIHLMIDEPEKFCHPNLLWKISNCLQKLATNINLYISTHSPELLNSLINIENMQIKYFREKYIKDNDSSETIIPSEILEQTNFKPILIKNQILRLEFMRLFFSTKIIVVEDIAQKILIQYILNKNKIFSNIEIIIVYGKENFESFFNFATKILKIIPQKLFCIYDEDKTDRPQDSLEKGINKTINEKFNDQYYAFVENIEVDLQCSDKNKQYGKNILNFLDSYDATINENNTIIKLEKWILSNFSYIEKRGIYYYEN